MIQVFKFLAAATIAVGIATPASAAVIYDDRTNWEAAISGTITNDPFASPKAEAIMITFDSGVTSIASNLVATPSNIVRDPPGADNDIKFQSRAGGLGVVTLTWTFPVAVTGFGADFFGAQNVFVTGDFDGTGDQIFEIDASIGSADGFFGIVGMAPFTTITITGAANGSDFYGVDNLAFAAAPSGNVPEPGTLALIGFGLAGLGFARKRRN